MRTASLILFSFLPFSQDLFCRQNEPVIDVHLHAHNLWQAQSDTAWYPSDFSRPASDYSMFRISITKLKYYFIAVFICNRFITSSLFKIAAKHRVCDRLLCGYYFYSRFCCIPVIYQTIFIQVKRRSLPIIFFCICNIIMFIK